MQIALPHLVRQMSGKIVVLEITDETTVGEFKEQLRGWQPSQDDLTHRSSQVRVTVGEKLLTENEETVPEAGVSPEAVVHVQYTIHAVECASRREYDKTGCDFSVVVLVRIPQTVAILGRGRLSCYSGKPYETCFEVLRRVWGVWGCRTAASNRAKKLSGPARRLKSARKAKLLRGGHSGKPSGACFEALRRVWCQTAASKS